MLSINTKGTAFSFLHLKDNEHWVDNLQIKCLPRSSSTVEWYHWILLSSEQTTKFNLINSAFEFIRLSWCTKTTLECFRITRGNNRNVLCIRRRVFTLQGCVISLSSLILFWHSFLESITVLQGFSSAPPMKFRTFEPCGINGATKLLSGSTGLSHPGYNRSFPGQGDFFR